MDNLNKRLDKYVKLSQEQRQKKRRWLSRKGEELEFEAFIRQQKHYYALSKYKNEENLSVLYFAAYTLAAAEIYDLMNSSRMKNKSNDIHEVIDSTELTAKNLRKRRNRKVWEGLLNRKYVIMKLHYQGISSRDISKEIKDPKNKFSASHKIICDFITEMKGE